ncbi:MAG: alpha-amylase family glycosyl hydrolase, partial [Candidatus Parvarchaeum sp.]
MRVYQIFVDRFSTGNKDKDAKLAFKTSRKWMGGNLNGIIGKLDYIKNLGFDAIWLTPIFSAANYHGYSTLDFYSVDKHFGSNKTLKKLVDKAHLLGLKVILDFVANHVSNRHPFFTSAINNKKSEYRNWFIFNEKNDYMSFLGVKELPKLNTRNDSVINYLIDAAIFWIKEFGIDGYRLDHAIGPSFKFWQEFVHSCREVNNDMLFLPEIWLSGVDKTYIDTLWFLDDGQKRSYLMSLLDKNSGKTWDEIT